MQHLAHRLKLYLMVRKVRYWSELLVSLYPPIYAVQMEYRPSKVYKKIRIIIIIFWIKSYIFVYYIRIWETAKQVEWCKYTYNTRNGASSRQYGRRIPTCWRSSIYFRNQRAGDTKCSNADSPEEGRRFTTSRKVRPWGPYVKSRKISR